MAVDGETVETESLFSWAPKSLQNHWWLQPGNYKTLASWKKSYDKPRQHIKKQRYYFANKGPSNQSYGFSSSHVWMWKLDYKQRGAPKNWCFWIVVLEKTLESPLDCKEIKPVHLKGNQSWIFFGGTDAEAENPILWPLMWRTDSLERPWCWESLKAGGEGDDRGWDGWMASPTQWTWAWVNSRSWRWTGRPGVLQSIGSQRVRHDWATELNCKIVTAWVRVNHSQASGDGIRTTVGLQSWWTGRSVGWGQRKTSWNPLIPLCPCPVWHHRNLGEPLSPKSGENPSLGLY